MLCCTGFTGLPVQGEQKVAPNRLAAALACLLASLLQAAQWVAKRDAYQTPSALCRGSWTERQHTSLLQQRAGAEGPR